jgi:quercetin dioxygenase-like cupin family protein
MTSDSVLRTLSEAPQGKKGQSFLASGQNVALRYWYEGPNDGDSELHAHDYETVGLALGGRAVLEMEGESYELSKDVSWVVPSGAKHRYIIHDTFTAVEATSPPAREQS